MTEAEWLACTNPAPMFNFLQGKASARKLRLFACAYCRHAWHLFDEHSQTLVEEVERDTPKWNERPIRALPEIELCLGDQRASQTLMLQLPKWWWLEIALNSGQVHLVKQLVDSIAGWLLARANNSRAALHAAPGDEVRAARAAWAVVMALKTQEESLQCDLLREILGNPFHPETVQREWLNRPDGTVTHIAKGIARDRAFNRLPILAAALLDAGCTDEALLLHCRNPEGHVLGCWALDLILGKE